MYVLSSLVCRRPGGDETIFTVIVRLEIENSILRMILSIGSSGYAKPQEVLIYGFGMKEKEVLSLLINREGLFVKREDKYLSPMEII